MWGSQKNRVTTVYAWQTGYQGYYDQALIDLGSRKSSFDALAITGYFGCDKATTKHVSVCTIVQWIGLKEYLNHVVVLFTSYIILNFALKK